MSKLMTLSSTREEKVFNYLSNYLVCGFWKDKNDFILKFYKEYKETFKKTVGWIILKDVCSESDCI